MKEIKSVGMETEQESMAGHHACENITAMGLYNPSYQIIFQRRNVMSKEKSPAGTINIEEVLSQMTLEEKAQMCSGRDSWKAAA